MLMLNLILHACIQQAVHTGSLYVYNTNSETTTYIVRVTDWRWHVADVVNAVALFGDRRFPGDVFAVGRDRDVDGSVAGGRRVDGEVGRLAWQHLAWLQA